MSDAYLAFTARLPYGDNGPTVYSATLAASICERIANGDTLTAVCRNLRIPQGAVRRWMLTHADFLEAVNAAKMMRAEAVVDGMQDVCTRALRGKAQNVGAVLQNMQWRARVMDPAQFGEKQELAVTGGLSIAINTRWTPPSTIEGEATRADDDEQQDAPRVNGAVRLG